MRSQVSSAGCVHLNSSSEHVCVSENADIDVVEVVEEVDHILDSCWVVASGIVFRSLQIDDMILAFLETATASDQEVVGLCGEHCLVYLVRIGSAGDGEVGEFFRSEEAAYVMSLRAQCASGEEGDHTLQVRP